MILLPCNTCWYCCCADLSSANSFFPVSQPSPAKTLSEYTEAKTSLADMDFFFFTMWETSEETQFEEHSSSSQAQDPKGARRDQVLEKLWKLERSLDFLQRWNRKGETLLSRPQGRGGGGSPLTVWCCLEDSSLAMFITATFCNCCDSREQVGVEERALRVMGIDRLVSYLSSAMAASFDLDQALGSHDPLCSRILHS